MIRNPLVPMTPTQLCRRAAMGLAAAAFVFWMPQTAAQESAARGLLQRTPAGAQVALAAPSIDALDVELKSMPAGGGEGTAGLADTLSKEFKVEGASGLADAVTRLGVNTAQPAALFLAVTGGMKFGTILPLSDPAKFEAHAATLSEGPLSDVEFPGGVKGKSNAEGSVNYFIEDGKGFYADSKALAEGLAATKGTPATVHFGGEGAPSPAANDIVILTQLEHLGGLLSGGGGDSNLRMIAPVFKFFGERCDEAVITVSTGSTPATVRLAMHDKPGVEAPAADTPLSLYKALPNDALAVANFRITPETLALLNSVVKELTGATSDPNTQQTATMVNNLLTATLGPEVMAGMVNGPDGSAAFLAIVQLKTKQGPTFGALLNLLGADKDPMYKHNEMDVRAIRKFQNEALENPIFFAVSASDVLFVSNLEDALKSAIDVVASGNLDGGGFVSPELVALGNHGFAQIKSGPAGDAIKNLPLPIPLPAGLDFSKGDMSVAMHHNSPWRGMTLSSPIGVAAFADLILPALGGVGGAAKTE